MKSSVDMKSASHRSRRSAVRVGAVAVEFAIVAPITFMLFFAAYEFSRANMVRHSLDIAAYEGARAGITPGATVDDVEQRVTRILKGVGVRGATIEVSPDPIGRTTPAITVEVDVAMGPNSWTQSEFFRALNMHASATLAREGFTSND
ncbi:MAG: pilus assembly protein [Planctomycetales bacterium]|nr:pilus assembly protein [Planctomycetales bacterium]